MAEGGLAVAAATAASPTGRVGSRALGADEVLAKAARENFPVALSVLSPVERRRLEAIYGYARLVDDVGDLYEGDRAALLDWIEADLGRAYEGRAEHPLLQRVSTLVRDLALPRGPFLRLLEANRRDQVVSRYAAWDELAAYCDLSANPVGELVLHVFGAATPERIAWSDSICTGLQLAEHWQDVGEDFGRGRIYVPQEDMARFGVGENDLASDSPTEAFRALMAFETERARALLAAGLPLVASLSGRHRLAIAAYVGGGRAALDAVEQSGFDVLRRSPRAGGGARVAATVGALRGGGSTKPVGEAYAYCRDVTRESATSFYHGMRLLPGPRRRAMYAVYAFARRVDDIADGPLAAGEKVAALERARADVASLGPGVLDAGDPVLVALSDAAARYAISRNALTGLIDGAAMDVDGHEYESFDDLVVYCRLVAGTIGRLSLAVFGATDKGAAAMALADDLGVAFQLTNILRDVREDLAAGRLYLPREDLAAFGCRVHGGTIEGDFGGLVRFQAARAETWYERGLALVPLLDRQSAACVGAMAGIYRRLLHRIEHEPAAVLAGRLSLPGWEKGWVAARSLAGVGA